MLHELIKIWFLWVEQWGYWGVFVLMAMESSIIPVPSEIVMPPAAFWAAQGKMSLAGVILAGTLGSYIGSILSYLACSLIGRPLVLRYGKYFLISPEKLAIAEAWINRYGFFWHFSRAAFTGGSSFDFHASWAVENAALAFYCGNDSWSWSLVHHLILVWARGLRRSP